MSDPADAAAVRAYWDSRARLGERAGTNDLLLKRLEIAYLRRFLRPHLTVVDVGCGTGQTLRALARRQPALCGYGWDASAAMVRVARQETREDNRSGHLSFHQRDAETTPCGGGATDVVYTERLLINLGTWERQRAVVLRLSTLLDASPRAQARLVLVEHSQDALDRLNGVRAAVALPSITPPWHNRYLREAEMASLDGQEGLRLERVDHFTSTYYFLSRVVNAWWAARAGRAPRYDALVNRLALHLPPVGTVGQCVGWVFRREG